LRPGRIPAGAPQRADLAREAHRAARGLAELAGIIERGDLLAFLARTCPIGPLDPPAAPPAGRVPLSQVPVLDRESRATWLCRNEPAEP